MTNHWHARVASSDVKQGSLARREQRHVLRLVSLVALGCALTLLAG
jgi:hypothetical protein